MRLRIPFLALLTANAISLLGNMLTGIALPWFVLETTGSVAKAGLAAFFTAVPFVVAAFVGGALIDRIGAKFMSIASDILSGVTVAAIPLLFVTDLLQFWHVLVLVFFSGLLDSPGTTARQTLLPRVAAHAGISLDRANSAYTSIQYGSYLAGAPLGGLVIALVGASDALLVDAATFSASAAIVGAAVPGAVRTSAVTAPLRRDIVDGLRFIASERVVRAILVGSVVGSFFTAPIAPLLLPVYGKEVLNDALLLGALIGAYGGGALAGSVLYGVGGRRFSRRTLYVGGFAGMTLGFAALATVPPFAVFALAMVWVGLLAGAVNPMLSTVRFERIPPELHGRVFGAVSALMMITAPIGILTAGFVVDRWGLAVAFGALAVAHGAITLGQLASRALRLMSLAPVAAATPQFAGPDTG
jgi:MFS family permease